MSMDEAGGALHLISKRLPFGPRKGSIGEKRGEGASSGKGGVQLEKQN
jgi:hypothetical protein